MSPISVNVDRIGLRPLSLYCGKGGRGGLGKYGRRPKKDPGNYGQSFVSRVRLGSAWGLTFDFEVASKDAGV
jgi:hypothetical protein